MWGREDPLPVCTAPTPASGQAPGLRPALGGGWGPRGTGAAGTAAIGWSSNSWDPRALGIPREAAPPAGWSWHPSLPVPLSWCC